MPNPINNLFRFFEEYFKKEIFDDSDKICTRKQKESDESTVYEYSKLKQEKPTQPFSTEELYYDDSFSGIYSKYRCKEPDTENNTINVPDECISFIPLENFLYRKIDPKIKEFKTKLEGLLYSTDSIFDNILRMVNARLAFLKETKAYKDNNVIAKNIFNKLYQIINTYSFPNKANESVKEQGIPVPCIFNFHYLHILR